LVARVVGDGGVVVATSESNDAGKVVHESWRGCLCSIPVCGNAAVVGVSVVLGGATTIGLGVLIVFKVLRKRDHLSTWA